jgi:FkbM family methyltransferase
MISLGKSLKRSRQLVKALKLLPHPLFRRALYHGIGASIEHRGILGGLGAATVVDIGANIGQFSLLARALYPEARIYAFEPLGAPAARFADLFAGDSNVTLYRLAIGPGALDMTMNVSGKIDSSSLLPITEAQVAFAPGTAAVRTEAVSVARLDSVLNATQIVQPALLKLDVQGYELPALQGCGELLDRFRWIYAEVSFSELYRGQALAPDIIEFLRARDFVLGGVNNPSYAADGSCVQADFLFRSK